MLNGKLKSMKRVRARIRLVVEASSTELLGQTERALVWRLQGVSCDCMCLIMNLLKFLVIALMP